MTRDSDQNPKGGDLQGLHAKHVGAGRQASPETERMTNTEKQAAEHSGDAPNPEALRD